MPFDFAAMESMRQPIEEREEHQELDYLIAQVRSGALTPELAEAEAAEKQFGPISQIPSVSSFDPFLEPLWTLDMSLAWIAWRSAAMVTYHWKQYRDRCLGWKPSKRLKYNEKNTRNSCSPFRLVPPAMEEFATLERLSGRSLWLDDNEPNFLFFRDGTLASVDVIFSPEGDPKNALLDLADARKTFLVALKQGNIVASAINTNNDEAVEIPASEWQFLVACRGDDGYTEFSRREPDEDDPEHWTPKYRWVTVRRADLIAWSAQVTESNSPNGADVDDRIDFDRYLVWCRTLDLTKKKVAVIAWRLWIAKGIKISTLAPVEIISAVGEFVAVSELVDKCHDVTPDAVEGFIRAYSATFRTQRMGNNEAPNKVVAEQQSDLRPLDRAILQNMGDDRFPADLSTTRRPRSEEERRRYFRWCESLKGQTALKRVGQLYWDICSGDQVDSIEPRTGILIRQLKKAAPNPVSESSIKKFRKLLLAAIENRQI